MENRWADSEVEDLVSRYDREYPRELILRSYSARLLGSEKSLVLHGGGNTSVKGEYQSIHQKPRNSLFIKASGFDLATIEPKDHIALDLERLQALSTLGDLSDSAMLNELRASRYDQSAPLPSIETLVHAVLPGRYVDHTHADVILALTNQEGGEFHVKQALGPDVTILPYVKPGFPLGHQVAKALCETGEVTAMVWMHHGLVVWGETARESYSRMIELVSRAEKYLDKLTPSRDKPAVVKVDKNVNRRLAALAPILRGLLATPIPGGTSSYQRVVLQSLTDVKTRALLANLERSLLVSPPLTGDHVVRTKTLPAWLDIVDFFDDQSFRSKLESVLKKYSHDYEDYFQRHKSRLPEDIVPHDSKPRVLLINGLGVVCAGSDATSARIVRDITEQALNTKNRIAAMDGIYKTPTEEHLFDMEYLPQQQLKLVSQDSSLKGNIVMVTGAAGAIGSGICTCLLDAGAHVVVADIDEDSLTKLKEELEGRNCDRIMAIQQDVSDPDSVAASFAKVCETWGGLDGLVVNAGLAHVSTLEEMDIHQFRCIERVNTEGTLLLLQAASKVFRKQGTGGDIVLISTKNVFAPGAEFGAYSATKAAAHQLARIASQEMAADDIRVNMVAPDAVFSHGSRRSGLWEKVGPERMRSRGLDEVGLEEYYRDRNLLKAQITANHVGEGVLFFLQRRTPTTGATLPIDGGLPEATPR